MAAERETALLVGGDERILARVMGTLEAAGYEVRVVGSCDEAPRALTRWSPGVILVDLGLSSGDGRAFYEAHARTDKAGIPVVLLGVPDGVAGSPVAVADPLDAPDLLAAVWVATTP